MQGVDRTQSKCVVVDTFCGGVEVCAVHGCYGERRGLKIVTHNARGFVRVGGLGLEDWRSG